MIELDKISRYVVKNTGLSVLKGKRESIKALRNFQGEGVLGKPQHLNCEVASDGLETDELLAGSEDGPTSLATSTSLQNVFQKPNPPTFFLECRKKEK